MINMRGISTSKKEIKDILTAWVAISLVIVIATRGFGMGLLTGFMMGFLTVGIAFITHELSHKIVAQKMGYSAEFEKFTPMLIISLVMAFIGFVFIAPGAVVIRGLGITNEENGKISLAGPLSNLIIGFVGIIYSFFLPIGLLKNFLVFFAFVNCMIGLFNMIPFWVLDGKKIFVWNKKVYTGMLVMFFILYIMIKFNI